MNIELSSQVLSLPDETEHRRALNLTASELAELDHRAQAHLTDPSSATTWEAAQQRIRQRFGFEL